MIHLIARIFKPKTRCGHRRDQGPQGQAAQGHLRPDLRQPSVGIHVPAVRRGRHA
nr:MAG TPA: hypothetical protein [Caudoviricetes sp.]